MTQNNEEQFDQVINATQDEGSRLESACDELETVVERILKARNPGAKQSDKA